MRVSDLMTIDVITIAPTQGLNTALALLDEFGVRHLPVLDPETGKLVGIVTNREIEATLQSFLFAQGEVLANRTLEQIEVASIMEVEYPVIGANASVGEAARRLVAHKVTGLPVVEYDAQGNATLIGLVTASDLLRYLADLEGARQAEG